MIEAIKHIEAIKIVREINTIGSSPLQVICSNGFVYYVKTSTTTIPRVELINEILCNYFLKTWNLNAPEMALVNIDKVVVDAYLSENKALSKRYNTNSFNDKFIGFKEISPASEIDVYIKGLSSKAEWNQLINPLDLIKIGIFDYWVCNKDRKPDNPNILLKASNSKFSFHPIDHTAAFGYQTNYSKLNENLLFLESKFSILNIPLVKSIAKFAPKSELSNLKDNVLLDLECCNKNMDEIFNQVPSNWGFSKKAKEKLKDLLSDVNRNNNISKVYFPYI